MGTGRDECDKRSVLCLRRCYWQRLLNGLRQIHHQMSVDVDVPSRVSLIKCSIFDHLSSPSRIKSYFFSYVWCRAQSAKHLGAVATTLSRRRCSSSRPHSGTSGPWIAKRGKPTCLTTNAILEIRRTMLCHARSVSASFHPPRVTSALLWSCSGVHAPRSKRGPSNRRLAMRRVVKVKKYYEYSVISVLKSAPCVL